MTHTPGPWKVAQTLHNAQLRTPDKKGYAGGLAYVFTDRPYPQGKCIATVREELFGELGANAALIAAAPAMLEALIKTRVLVNGFRSPADMATATHIIDKALRLAEGRV